MIRPMFWGALVGAWLFVLFLISLPFTQAAEARGCIPSAISIGRAPPPGNRR